MGIVSDLTVQNNYGSSQSPATPTQIGQDSSVERGTKTTEDPLLSEPKPPTGKIRRTKTSVINKNFFARWFKMTKFHQRWCALPLFEEDIVEGGCFPIIKETKGYKALKALHRHAGSRKGSVWDMFVRVYTKMYMEVTTVPAPPAAAIQKKTGKIIGPQLTNPANQFRGVVSHFVKPQCLFSIAPMCNVLFPSMINNFNYQENYIAQPTRVKIRGLGHGSNLAKYLAAGTNALFASIVKQLLNTGYPSVVYKRAKQYIKAPGSNDENFLLFPEEMFKGPVVKRMSAPPWMRHLQQQVNAQKKAYLKKAIERELLEEGLLTGQQEGESDETYQKRRLKEVRDRMTELDEMDKTEFVEKYVEEKREEWTKAPSSTFSKSEYEERLDNLTATSPYVQGVEQAADNVEKFEEQARQEAEEKWQKLSRSEPKSIGSLMRKYAEYEFLRARYEQRSSAVDISWNPYLVAGFPLVVLDQRASGYDCIGYLTAVSHGFSAQSDGAMVDTRVNTAFMRTLQEEQRDQIREPISSIRKILQDATNATEFFKSIFFKKQDPGKPVVFQADEVLETKNERYQLVGPTEEYEKAFDDYGAAMNLVARPGCTLKEYVEMWHGKDIDTLLAEGTVEGENRSFYSVIRDSTSDQLHGGAVYWSRIYKLKQGAGTNPGAKVTNINDDDMESPSATGFRPVDDEHGDMPQTRYDWDTILERYRAILLGEGIGSVPQE